MGSLVHSKFREDLVEHDRKLLGQLEMPSLAEATGEPRDPGVSWHSGLPVNWQGGGGSSRPHSPIDLFLKRALDIVGALVGICALGPLLIIVALVIKATSPGPVLFRQSREGLNGRVFEALKFRSMREAECDPSGVTQTLMNDPRVTLVGRFIRKTSIDELPQLFNVLVGDMSLVGPRPHVANMLAGGQLYRELVPHYGQRLTMRPGITGWAQANGLRGPTRDPRLARERIDHDIAYIQNFSIWLDLKIIMMTIVREFFTGNGD